MLGRFQFLPLLTVLMVIGFSASFAQNKTVTYYADPSAIPPDLPVRITHLTAHVRFTPEENKIIGTADFTFTRNRLTSDPIIFFTPDFSVSSVKIDQEEVKYEQSGSRLIIQADQNLKSEMRNLKSEMRNLKSEMRNLKSEMRNLKSDSVIPHHLTITYTARPLSGNPYFIGWKPEEEGKRRQIWAHRPHGWLPYIDGRITVDMFVTFDKKYKVFSNGERMAITGNPDGTNTWHYAMKKDHPFFSTALVIGDYDYKQGKTARGVPLEFWYYPDMADRLATTYMFTERMFDFLEEDLGFNYPYPLYREAPVIDYMYGAMETTTSTIFGDYMQITPRSWWQRNYVNVNVHELAHQWFGNCVAHFVNRDVWLTESFATYYAKIFEKKIYGEDYWQNLRNDEMNLTFDAAKLNSFPVGGSQGGTQRIYQKGSLVLEMLRNVMGDADFRKAVNRYLRKYAFDYAETNDFIRCVYEAGGKSYQWFFDEWILRGGEPDYLVTDSVATDSAGTLMTIFRVRQVQQVNELNGLFKMPIPFEVHYIDGSSDSLVSWVEKQETLVRVPNPSRKEVDYLLFDPNRTILKHVTFDQPVERRISQALKAKNMIDRYDALAGLREVPVDRKAVALQNMYFRENFHLNKSEILRQLANDTSPASGSVKAKALTDKDALVRKTALLVNTPLPENLRITVEAMLYDTSFVNVELALEALCLSFPGRIPDYLDQTKTMEGWRGKNIRMKWLEISITSGNRQYLKEVIGYCSPKYEFETRINAFNLLKKLSYHDPETLKYAETAGRHWNNKLSTVAKQYLSTINP